mgnify:CR=1 FL=1
MVKLRVFDKDDKEIKTLELKDEQLVNQRFKRKNSILDILLDNGVNMFYGCMGGSCSACVCDLINGEEYIEREGVHEQVYKGISENEFLTCIASIKQGLSEDSIIEIRTKF